MTDSETALGLNFWQFREAPMRLEANELVNGQTQVKEAADLPLQAVASAHSYRFGQNA